MPYISMNQPQVHMCVPSWIPPPLLPRSIPLGCSRPPALGALLHASNLHWSSILHMLMYISMLFSQTIPQNYSDRDRLVLAQRQQCKSMEQNEKSRDKFTHVWIAYLWQRRQKYRMEKRYSLQQVVLEKLVNYVLKNEIRRVSNSIYKKKHKMD